MSDWQQKLDDFLKFNDREVLLNAGSISKKQADDFAKEEYVKFAEERRHYIEKRAEEEYMKDLEETVKKLPEKNGNDNETEI